MELGRFKSVLNSSSILLGDRNLDSACLGQQDRRASRKNSQDPLPGSTREVERIDFVLASDVPIHHDHLLTLILNLASNALDAMEKGEF